MIGSDACFGSRSSPWVTSRLISSPATKKNSTIATSLIQSRRSRLELVLTRSTR